LLEHVRSLVLKTKLPKNLWSKAINITTYLFNRSPIRLNSSITPYEKISSTKPNLSHLRTFGCRTFVYIDKVNRRGKLDSKSIECIHLGYNLETKGDRLYNPIIKKIFIDWNVKFIETLWIIELPHISHESKSSEHPIIVKSENLDPSSPPKINIHVDLPIESYSSVELPNGPLDIVDSPKDTIGTSITNVNQDENPPHRRSN
jgi:hypothetical protein